VSHRLVSALALALAIVWAWLAHTDPANFLRWTALLTLCG
jgi:hypothetical protein